MSNMNHPIVSFLKRTLLLVINQCTGVNQTLLFVYNLSESIYSLCLKIAVKYAFFPIQLVFKCFPTAFLFFFPLLVAGSHDNNLCLDIVSSSPSKRFGKPVKVPGICVDSDL